jgi:3-methyl-2-oxobutanoate hydroxymethyltransferase
VLVLHDLLGLNPGRTPRHVKVYADLRPTVIEAVARYRDEVREGKFPGEEHAFS